MPAPADTNISDSLAELSPASLVGRSLRCVRGDRVLFENLDLRLDAGEILQIDGANGSGKTSFLMLIDEKLREANIEAIWFNAWKYDKEDNLWSALIQRILDQAKVRGRIHRRLYIKFKIWWRTVDLDYGLWTIFKKIFPILFFLLLSNFLRIL